MTEQEFKILNDQQHHRLRAEMYVGSRVAVTADMPLIVDGKIQLSKVTYVPAVLTCFREALDNALDELSFIGGGTVEVNYDEAQSIFKVRDNGRGIPLDYNEEEQAHIATIAVSKTKAGRNFGDRGETAGINGLGISVVNSLSDWFQVEVVRGKKHFSQRFEGLSDELISHAPKIKDTKHQSFTSVNFKLSSEVFSDLALPTELVYSLLYMIRATQPKIKIRFNGELLKVNTGNLNRALFANDFKEAMNIDIKDDDTDMRFVMKTQDDLDFHVFSLVNNIPAFDGGSHVNEFRISFIRNITAALAKESRKRKLPLVRSDITDGLFIFNVTKMKAPTFDSQSKTRLINKEIVKTVSGFMNDPEKMNWVKFVRQNSAFVEKIFDRAAVRQGSKNDYKLNVEAKKLKRQKIPNLIDATGRDRSVCTLTLFEGNSAASTFTAIRDPKRHGALPLRGKVKNVWGASPLQALNSDTLKQICSAFGIVPGKKIDKSDLRYHKLVIATDQDPDGASILTLLVTFLYNFWPEMFDEDNPMVYVLKTPLIVIAKGKQQKYFYSGDHFDMSEWSEDGWKFVARLKGLGAMELTEWRDHSVDDPEVLVPIYDDGKLKQTLSLISAGDQADNRKQMMIDTVDETLDSFE